MLRVDKYDFFLGRIYGMLVITYYMQFVLESYIFTVLGSCIRWIHCDVNIRDCCMIYARRISTMNLFH